MKDEILNLILKFWDTYPSNQNAAEETADAILQLLMADVPVLSEEVIGITLDTCFKPPYVSNEYKTSRTAAIKELQFFFQNQARDTALRMEALCQKRIEGIFERIERNPFQYFKATWGQFEQQFTGDVEVREKEWLALKSKALKEKG